MRRRCPCPLLLLAPSGRSGEKPCDAPATLPWLSQEQQQDCPNGQEFSDKDHCGESARAWPSPDDWKPCSPLTPRPVHYIAGVAYTPVGA
jgi:hypothetical protein